MDTRNTWFGRSWGAPCCEPHLHGPTPIGEPCAWCAEPIAEDDSGLIMLYVGGDRVRLRPLHAECQARSVLGSIAHVQRRCTCFGGPEDDGDPPHLSRREAAKLVVWLSQEPIEA